MKGTMTRVRKIGEGEMWAMRSNMNLPDGRILAVVRAEEAAQKLSRKDKDSVFVADVLTDKGWDNPIRFQGGFQIQ